MKKLFLLMAIFLIPAILCLNGTNLLWSNKHITMKDQLDVGDSWRVSSRIQENKWDPILQGFTSEESIKTETPNFINDNPSALWNDPDPGLKWDAALIITVMIVAGLFLTRHTTEDTAYAKRTSLIFIAGTLLLPFAIILSLIGLKGEGTLMGIVGASFLLFSFLEVILEMARAALS
jgi:hypothetical protein